MKTFFHKKYERKENNTMTKLTLFLHILLAITTALVCWGKRKDKVGFVLWLGTTVCWIILIINEAIDLFG